MPWFRTSNKSLLKFEVYETSEYLATNSMGNWIFLDSEKKYLFFENKVQDLLKRLTRKDVSKVFRKRKDGEKVEAAVYKFMTTAQLEEV